jgi:anti-sigma factor RsiW
MTCFEFTEFLMAYLDGELPPEQHAQFQEHMDRCPPCVRYLHSYRLTVRLGREAFADPDAAVSDDVPEELVRAVLAARRGAKAP